MTLVLTLWLLAGHRQVIQADMTTDHVTVFVCQGRKGKSAHIIEFPPVALYADEHMTVPEANPVQPDSTGTLLFVVGKSGCYKVVEEPK